MIQKKRLTAFYVEQYTKASKKRPRKMPGTNEMLYKTEKLFRLLKKYKILQGQYPVSGGISPAVEKCGDVCQKKKQG